MTVRIEHILKETIKDLKVRIIELERERDEAWGEAEKLIAVIDDIQENGAVYDIQSLTDGLPWEADHA